MFPTHTHKHGGTQQVNSLKKSPQIISRFINQNENIGIIISQQLFKLVEDINFKEKRKKKKSKSGGKAGIYCDTWRSCSVVEEM